MHGALKRKPNTQEQKDKNFVQVFKHVLMCKGAFGEQVVVAAT